ncbi:MAG: nucleotidyltransferase domain-containing protein [Minisyncoccota bacterium]
MGKSVVFKEKYPPLLQSSERTQKALTLFKEIAREARKENWRIAFLSGLATDAHFGYLTRDHRDVDLIASRETAQKIRTFLESLGHTVYEPDKVKGECLKVDQAESDKPMRAHCDIHYFREDEEGRVIIPLFGKELHFSANLEDSTDEIEFLCERSRFLKTKYLLEEKDGWRDQIGLTGHEEENERERRKIEFLIKPS